MDKGYNTVIERLNSVINQYWNASIDDGNSIVEYMKTLSTGLFYLNTVRIEAHNKWQVKVKELVEQGNSVARAENMAHVAYPEMYELRRVMDSGYKVLETLRSNLSYLKQERNNSNIIN